MQRKHPLPIKFYRTRAGREPVREWLHRLGRDEKKAIVEDLKTVQFGWPVGMPLAEKLERDVWQVRTDLEHRISRVLFTVYGEMIVLLHGFIKKTPRTPAHDLALARRRLQELQEVL
jgi:phage-related protein